MTGQYPQSLDLFTADDDTETNSVFDYLNKEYRTGAFFDSDGLYEMWRDGVDTRGYANQISDILEFISDDNKPFFAFSLYRGTHLPYNLKYSEESYYRGCEQVLDKLREGREEEPNEVRHRYATAVEQFSEWYIASIVDRLKDENILDDTIIVITADHGETWTRGVSDLSEIDSFSLHGTVLYEDVLRVPLITYNIGDGSGRRVEELVRTVDIVPSLLDNLGINSAGQMDGISLVPATYGESMEFPSMAFSATTEYENPDEDLSLVGRFAVTIDDYKLIWNPKADTTTLYDLENDPEETVDVSSEHPDLAEDLRFQLIEHLNERDYEFGEQDEDIVRSRLEDLGYL